MRERRAGYHERVGWLEHKLDQRVHPLTAETVVGRSRRADLRLAEDFVSSLHAALVWQGRHWEVKDLGSHNGTAVNGRLVPAGTRRRLEEGDELTFGQSASTWTLRDGGGPEALAQAEDRAAIVGADGLLVLPGPDDPEATVFITSVGRWRLETASESRDVADHEVVPAGGVQWRLRLPSIPGTTRSTAGTRALSLDEVELSLMPGAEDQTLVAVKSTSEAFSFVVGAGSAVLRALVQARLGGHEGWVDRDELVDRLSINDNHLNVDVYRIRRQFADAGFIDAARVIERRKGRLRLGTARMRFHAP
ncbi:FHA domain-containing protein [Paraliomyxa miuraensis]|uniref:FHA domain-containing protein n=1 Tax=Paraliomyxa miuraensis TaxID=376150 RepID=UPI002255D13D|nr:FHA domain-containing protein [Paraliomyxa miuraensis]MCX4240832.1 FHA domain-containing protein [Paraliomyxa miuraensis]